MERKKSRQSLWMRIIRDHVDNPMPDLNISGKRKLNLMKDDMVKCLQHEGAFSKKIKSCC